MTGQGEMFGSAALPDDEIVLCTACGRQITQHFAKGHVQSEYRDGQGRCFQCNRKNTVPK